MNAKACAVLSLEDQWRVINWDACHDQVKRMQVRIVKATREGRWGRVKALQHLLTRSFSAKALAVKRVTENRGKTTPGVDGVTWSTPEEKAHAVAQLVRHGYQPLPLRRVMIPKSNGKMRPLGIPTMKDRAMQALYLLALQPISEVKSDPYSFGFRPKRSSQDAAAQLRKVFYANPGKCATWALEGDIKACFDNIDHDWLLANVPMDKLVLRKWLKSGFIDSATFHDTEAGTPQGGIISPTLANMALDGIEQLLHQRYWSAAKKQILRKVHLVRYADDFIVTGDSKELLEDEIKPMIAEFLAARGMTLSQEKTKVTHVREGFDFLGWNFRMYPDPNRASGEVFLVKPSRKSMNSLVAKVREILRTSMSSTWEETLDRLNPVLRGWAMYHRYQNSKDVLARMDYVVWWMIWRWIKKRHAQKSGGWKFAKYTVWFDTNRRLGCIAQDRYGRRTHKLLVQMAGIEVKKYIQIQRDANPFDPSWAEYFLLRSTKLMTATLYGQPLRLWRRQKGICPNCLQLIDEDSIWDSHHILSREHGGENGDENRVLVHTNCHRQVHSRKYDKAQIVSPV
jgi:RNA-directed DNA polymerase